MGEGRPEQFDASFLWYVARWNAGPGKRLEAKLEAYRHLLVRLRSPSETRAWLASLSG